MRNVSERNVRESKKKTKINCLVKRDQLDVTCFLISLFNAQYYNISVRQHNLIIYL